MDRSTPHLPAAVTINAAPPADVHAAIRHYREALKVERPRRARSDLDDDYVFVNGHGQLRTKADRLADIRSGASSIDSITHEEAPIVKTHGKTTLVLSRVTIVGRTAAARSRTTSAASTSGSTRTDAGVWCSISSRR